MTGMAGMAGMATMMSAMVATNALGVTAHNQREAQLRMEKEKKQRRENEALVQCALSNLRSAQRCKEVLKNQGLDLMEDPEFTELLARLNGIEYGFGAKEVFHRLQQTITDGTYREKFPVGRILPDKWMNPENREVIDAPLRIVDYREVKLADNSCKMAAILMRQYATKRRVAFSEEKSVKWADSTAYKYLNTEYLENCSAELQEALATTIVDGAYVKFFTPSLEELHILDDISKESMTYEYFLDTSINIKEECKKRKVTEVDESFDASYWLRNPHKEFPNNVHYMSYGRAYEARVGKWLHCLPVCVIVGE